MEETLERRLTRLAETKIEQLGKEKNAHVDAIREALAEMIAAVSIEMPLSIREVLQHGGAVAQITMKTTQYVGGGPYLCFQHADQKGYNHQKQVMVDKEGDYRVTIIAEPIE